MEQEWSVRYWWVTLLCHFEKKAEVDTRNLYRVSSGELLGQLPLVRWELLLLWLCEIFCELNSQSSSLSVSSWEVQKLNNVVWLSHWRGNSRQWATIWLLLRKKYSNLWFFQELFFPPSFYLEFILIACYKVIKNRGLQLLCCTSQKGVCGPGECWPWRLINLWQNKLLLCFWKRSTMRFDIVKTEAHSATEILCR